ncbi:MAG: TetR/AcrR family transcriptional regulator [Rhizomicrobium sp.]
MPKIVDHDVRRDDIARAAFRVIRRKGVARATIRDIAHESGSSVGAVVHYIPSKDHLFLQAAEYSTLVIRDRMERAEREHSGLEALRRVLYEGLPVNDDMLGHWKVWFGFWQLSETSELIRAATHDRYGESYRRYGRLMRAAQKAGEIRADVAIPDATASLICQMDGIGVHVLISGRPPSARKLRQQIDAWVDRMLGPGAARDNVVPLNARRGRSGEARSR